MSDGLIYNFGIQRNEDYARTWQFLDQDDIALDISAWTVEFRVNLAAGLGSGPLLTIGQTATVRGSVISLDDGVSGNAGVLFKKEDIALLPGRPSDVVPFAYNLLVTDGAGTRRADVRGIFIVEPGV